MIDAVAKALALWAVPYNDWDSMMEEQRERWRVGARAAIDAMPRDGSEIREARGEPIKAVRSERVAVRLSQLSTDGTSAGYSFRTQEDDGTWTYWNDVSPEKIVDGYAFFNLTDEDRVTPADG